MSSVKFNQELISKTEKTFIQKLLSEQSFWVSVALLGICFVMYFVEDAFSSKHYKKFFFHRYYGNWNDFCNNHSRY